jgi:hypothetical protein
LATTDAPWVVRVASRATKGPLTRSTTSGAGTAQGVEAPITRSCEKGVNHGSLAAIVRVWGWGRKPHLDALSVLKIASRTLLGSDPQLERVIIGYAGLDILSALVDNVPLTALVIDLVPVTNPRLWSLMAYCVGTGGSLLVIGSAAGVFSMGMVEGFASTPYLRIATMAVIPGYIAGSALWLAQTRYAA